MTTTPSPTLSRFTPSLMAAPLLERLFVAREPLVQAIIDRVEAAASTPERNHTLLVGPRGAGKTHLVSLVAHRIRALRSAEQALPLAWLPEDPWTIVSYRHLLAAIVDKLDPKFDGTAPRAEQELEAVLAARAAEQGPVTVIVENLDQILEALGNKGQQQLRHLLQSDKSLVLVATSTRLDRALSDQASPFYGFFTTTRLEPFDVDQTKAMLTAIARERGDDRLVEYLDTEQAERRLRTVAHLAGGQPRLWAVLASALTVETLDELVELLLTRFDDLTPYYQEQLGRLSGHQRLVVAELAEVDRPINVKELADRLDIEQRSLAKTMSELVERGWATPTGSRYVELLDRRRTYYELAEPLARLSFQLKESHGEPLRLIVEFIKHWFDTDELDGVVSEPHNAYLELAVAAHATDPVVAVCRQLQRLPATRARAAGLLGELDDALASLEQGDPEAFLRLPSAVRHSTEDRLRGKPVGQVRTEIHGLAQSEFGSVRHPAMESWIDRAEELVRASPEQPEYQLILASWLGSAWRFAEAREVLAAVEDDGGFGRFRVANNLLTCFWASGRTDEALGFAKELVASVGDRLDADDRRMLTIRHNYATALEAAGQTQEACSALTAVFSDRTRVLGENYPETRATGINLGTALREAGRVDEAIQLEERLLASVGRSDDDGDSLTIRNNLATSYLESGRAEEGLALLLEVLDARERRRGVDDADTLTSVNNLAAAYAASGRHDEAIATERRAVVDAVRILGADHPNALIARGNLAIYLARAAHFDEALEVLRQTIGDAETALGANHPLTMSMLRHTKLIEQDASVL